MIDARRKVLRRFYEPLLLLNALGSVRGKPIKPEASADSTGADVLKLRRSFLDGIAYICAFEKFTGCVTAAGLENTPSGPVLWLAANGGIAPTVLVFAEDVLATIHSLAAHDPKEKRQDEAEQVQPDLLRRVVTFNVRRLQSYILSIIHHHIEPCQKIMRSSRGSSDLATLARIDRLIQWLDETFIGFDPEKTEATTFFKLVQSCYHQRKSLLFEPLRLFASQGQPRAPLFEQLYKLLCKVGKHVTVTRTLTEAAVYLPQDFAYEFAVKALPHSPLRNLPLLQKEGTVDSILGRMFSSEEQRVKFRTRLESLWDLSQISNILHRERPVKTRVHAELLILDHFHRNKCRFLDENDRYIGCSKPACYLCHAYIVNHPGQFSLPASHQKLYVSWRVPDVEEDVVSAYQLVNLQEDMLLKLIEHVRRNLIQEMDRRSPRLADHADSTTGVTSELNPQGLTEMLSFIDLSPHEESPETLSMEKTKTYSTVDNMIPMAETENGGEEDDEDDDGGVLLS